MTELDAQTMVQITPFNQPIAVPTIDGKMADNSAMIIMFATKPSASKGWHYWRNIGSINWTCNPYKIIKTLAPSNWAYAYQLQTIDQIYVQRLRNIFINEDAYDYLMRCGHIFDPSS